MKRLLVFMAFAGVAWGQTALAGMAVAELIRQMALVIGILTLVLLVLVEFVFRRRMPRILYYSMLFISLFLFPAFILVGATSTVFEETKEVIACNTCHVMNPFVDDMLNPNSPTLAARHYQNRWIESHQCYSCHTTYGVHGTLEGKRDGFRHWFLYVTRSWNEPIQYTGSYPNINCYSCHDNTPRFLAVASHLALEIDMRSDRVGCFACHGPPHPAPLERPTAPPHSRRTAEAHPVPLTAQMLDVTTLLALPQAGER